MSFEFLLSPSIEHVQALRATTWGASVATRAAEQEWSGDACKRGQTGGVRAWCARSRGEYSLARGAQDVDVSVQRRGHVMRVTPAGRRGSPHRAACPRLFSPPSCLPSIPIPRFSALAGDWWPVLICSERKVLSAGCWWLICSERKVLLASGWLAKRNRSVSHGNW
jgi:hypothetical protein